MHGPWEAPEMQLVELGLAIVAWSGDVHSPEHIPEECPTGPELNWAPKSLGPETSSFHLVLCSGLLQIPQYKKGGNSPNKSISPCQLL